MPMSNLTIVLLPGLDGTGHLFEFLVPTLPPYSRPFVVSYPNELFLDYTDLQSYASGIIPATERFVLLGESFSGPIALNIASTARKNLVAVILVATFVKNPLSRIVSWVCYILGASLFRLPIPSSFIRKILLGKNSPENLVNTFLNVLQSVDPKILAYRLRSVLNVDVRQALLNCSVPILYLLPTRDKVVAKSSFDVILNLRHDIEVTLIDAPHMLLQCEPLIASQAIDNFLRQL